MQIKCTKEEWNMLEGIIVEVYRTETFYRDAEFICMIYEGRVAIIKIEGEFINESGIKV